MMMETVPVDHHGFLPQHPLPLAYNAQGIVRQLN